MHFYLHVHVYKGHFKSSGNEIIILLAAFKRHLIINIIFLNINALGSSLYSASLRIPANSLSLPDEICLRKRNLLLEEMKVKWS